MFSNIGGGELILVLIVLIFLFGGKKLPEIARGLGESSKELKKAKKEFENALNDVKNDSNDVHLKESATKGGDQS